MNRLHKWFTKDSSVKDCSKILLTTFFFLFLFTLSGLYASDYEVMFFRNSGLHTSNIISLGSDRDGKYILTSSDDSRAMLWDSTNGELLKTFLMPDGKSALMQSSIAPSGNMIALAAYELLVFNTENGRLLYRENIRDKPAKALIFSHDNDMLAVSHFAGIQVYETGSWNIIKEIPADNSAFTALAFDNFGWLTGLSAVGISLYDNEFNLNKFHRFEHERRPASLVVSPDGLAIAVGFFDEKPEVYDASTIEIMARPEIASSELISGHFSQLAFSANGHYLLAAGSARIATHNNDPENNITDIHRSDLVIGRWSHKGRGGFRAIPVGHNNINAMVSLPDGGFVYASEQPELVRIGPAFESVYTISSKANLFQADEWTMLKVNTNADEIYIQFNNMPALVFSLKAQPAGYLSELPARTRFRTAKQITPGIRLDVRKNSDSVLLNNKLIPWIEGSDRIQSADIADHGLRFILGSDRYIYCAARDGDLLWKTPVPGKVQFVNISGNAKVAVAAMKDGSIRWYRMSDGELLLNLFTYDSKKLWALCTPSGYYDHSQGAENLCGVMIQDPVRGSMVFTRLSAFSETHHKPDITGRLILDWDEEKALARLGISATELGELIMGNYSLEAFTKPRYCLIAGSYPKISLARERKAQLGEEGYLNVEIIRSGSNFRICIARFSRFSDAEKMRKELSDQFPGIWIVDTGKH